MDIREIFNQLRNHNPQFVFNNKSIIDVISPVLFTNKIINFDKDRLYIGTLSQIFESKIDKIDFNAILIDNKKYSIDSLNIENSNIALISDSKNMFDLFNEVQELFIANHNYQNSSLAILNMLVQGKDIKNIIHMASKIIERPIILLDTSFKVLAYSGSQHIEEPFWKKIIEKGYCSNEFITSVKKNKILEKASSSQCPIIVDSCLGNGLRRMVNNVVIDKRIVGYLVVLECSNEFLKTDHDLVNLICNVISKEMQKNKHYKNSKGLMYENLLIDLLEKRIDNEDTVLQRIKNASCNIGKNLYIITFDQIGNESSYYFIDFLRDSIESILPNSKTIYYNDRLVTFIDMKNQEFLSEKMLEDLKSFLSKNSIIAGISDRFSKILDFNEYYLQSLSTIKLVLKMGSNKHDLYLYQDYKTYYLFEIVSSKVDLRNFFHPAINRLLEYDKQNNTNYLETLYVYLMNNQNTSLSSERLFIHRNTMSYRISKIVDIINFDLKNSETVFDIYLSLKALNYLNTIESL